MEIIAGAARGVNLAVPQGEAVRPTAARARKALFDSLGRFDGTRIADLCAGAGGLGLEAASRGAAEVVFVEKNAAHCRILERNMAAVTRTGVNARMSVINCAMENTDRWCSGSFDVIFADPPYAESSALFQQLLEQHAAALSGTGAMLVWELPDTPGAKGSFLRTGSRFRKFGAAEFLFLDLKMGV